MPEVGRKSVRFVCPHELLECLLPLHKVRNGIDQRRLIIRERLLLFEYRTINYLPHQLRKDLSQMGFKITAAHPAITNPKGKLVGTACPVLTTATLTVVEVWVCGVVVDFVDVGIAVTEDTPLDVVWTELITALGGILPTLLLAAPGGGLFPTVVGREPPEPPAVGVK